MAMTTEQRKAMAIAAARGRLKSQPMTRDQFMARNALLSPEFTEEAPFMAQLGRGMMDVYQGGKQLALNVGAKTGLVDEEVAEDYNKRLSDEISLYEANNPDLQLGRIAGNLATPLSLIPGAAGAGAARAASVPALGGVFGALQPVQSGDNFFGTKAAQAATGAALAPVLPLAGRGIAAAGRGIRNVAAPLTAGGRERAVSDLMVREAGTDTGKIIDALQGRTTHVPGNIPTAGQAIADAARKSGEDFGASLVRLERDLGREGLSGQPLRTRLAEQAGRRKEAIQGIARNEEAMKDAVARRARMADPYYRDVEASVKNIRPDNVLNRINDIISKNVNEPGVVDPLRWIKSRLQDDLTPGAMQSLSKQIKNMSFEKNVAGKNLYSKGALNSVKKILDDEIGKTEKAFKTAQDVYRKGSRPINQMQVGREMALKLENAMETETPGTFLNAIRNAPRTVQRATGLGVYENLGDILRPGQLRKVDNVAQELLRQKQQAIMERSVRPIFSDIKGGIEPRLPRILERSVVIANHALSKLGVDKSDEYHKLALDMLMNPERLIQVLKQPEQDVSRKLAMQIVDRLSAQIPAQTAARSVGEQ